MEKRSLHYKDDKSDKFWTITLDSCNQTVHYGRTGSLGQTETKTFSTAEQAKQSVEKLIQQKLKKGYCDVFENTEQFREITEQPQAIADKIRLEVLENQLKSIPFDDNTAPKWLQIRVAEMRISFNQRKISWVTPADLPPLVIGEYYFNDEQVKLCLAVLQSTVDSHHSLLRNLKTYIQPQILDTFVWSLFERWLTEDAPPKEKWAMMALGLLGSDAVALKLTPLIRTWPSFNQFPRAVLGLECLRAIGTDIALMQIHGIAQTVKSQGLKKKAEECLQRIARDRNLTDVQLEDRIIPNLGLDERGQRVFDFGSRKFDFVLGADLKPMVRDEKGKISALPKPAAKDDAELANQATNDWKLLKKQIDQTVKIQSVRLEKAMIAERRWQWQDFENLLVRHPFMTHLVQRLIWGGYDSENQLVQTFRVAEDQTYASVSDELIQESIANVSVIHPINLTAKQRAAWNEALNDYEIIPPFSQINREIYT